MSLTKYLDKTKLNDTNRKGVDCERCSSCYGISYSNKKVCYSCKGAQCFVIIKNYSPSLCDETCGYNKNVLKEVYESEVLKKK